MRALGTYGELLRTTVSLAAGSDEHPIAVWTRLSAPLRAARGALVRADLLTPYVAEAIAEDALRAGPGARLELTVAPGTSVGALARLRARFADLEARGVDVSVTKQGPTDAWVPGRAA
jgi:hypothetical protein